MRNVPEISIDTVLAVLDALPSIRQVPTDYIARRMGHVSPTKLTYYYGLIRSTEKNQAQKEHIKKAVDAHTSPTTLDGKTEALETLTFSQEGLHRD